MLCILTIFKTYYVNKKQNKKKKTILKILTWFVISTFHKLHNNA